MSPDAKRLEESRRWSKRYGRELTLEVPPTVNIPIYQEVQIHIEIQAHARVPAAPARPA